MIVRQRRVIVCKPSTEKNMRPGWRLPPRSLRRGGRGAGHPQLDKILFLRSGPPVRRGRVNPRPATVMWQRPLIAKNAMNGAQLLKAPDGCSWWMSGPPAYI